MYGTVIKMEQIIRGAEQAGVKVTVVDFANEERFVTGLRIDKLLSSTEEDRKVAYVTQGDANVAKVRYFINEHVDVCLDDYSDVTYPPGSIFVIWNNYMMKACIQPQTVEHWRGYFGNEVQDECHSCHKTKKKMMFWDKYTCPYCPASLCSECATFGQCPACKKMGAFWNDLRRPY